MQDKEFSQALELLRFPLALMVVILHVFAWSSTIDSGWEHLDTFRMVNYARAINIAAFADTRVPLYFFMAGYFFFKINAFTPDLWLSRHPGLSIDEALHRYRDEQKAKQRRKGLKL